MTFTDEQLKLLGYNFIQDFDTDCCIVGGSILSVLGGFYPKDVDIYFYSKEDTAAAISKAKSLNYRIYTAAPISVRMEAKEFPQMVPINTNEYEAGTVGRPRHIDLITGLGDNMEKVLSNHGFSIQQIGIDKGGTIKFNEHFEEDFNNKNIRVTGDHPNKFLPNRARVLMKYLAKGYTISNAEFDKCFEGKHAGITSSEDQIEWLANFIIDYGMNNNKK